MTSRRSASLLFCITLIFALVSCERDNAITAPFGGDCDHEIVANTGAIEGYSDKDSYAPGDTIHFMVHTLESSFDVSITRHGVTNNELHVETDIPGMQQDYPACAFRSGCDWESVWDFVIPVGWSSGMYSARLTDGNNQFYAMFVLRKSDAAPQADLVVIASTNTWQAYNAWGGTSFYYLEDSTLAYSTVNFQRPNPVSFPYGDDGHLANAELHVLRWLEDNGYSYDLIGDRDLHDHPEIIENYAALIINTHGEYWTREMYDGLIAHLHNGGNMAYLSGNGIYWRTTIKGDQLEVQKQGANHYHDGLIGGLWRDLSIPESYFLGVSYDSRGYDTFAPYEVLDATHWIFDGTNVQNGDLIGEYSLNRGAASGHETDKMTSDSPANIVHLAKGTNPDNGGADMIYYERPEGGGVFSVGSVTFGGSLPVDAEMSQLVKNVLDAFIAP